VQKPENSLTSSEYPKPRRGSVFICAQARTHGRGARRNGAKVEAFDNSKFSEILEESANAQEEAQQPSNQTTKDIWTTERFSHPRGSAIEEHIGETIWTIGS
jgi:hypothetical protein